MAAVLLLLIVSVLALRSCGDDEDPATTATTATTTGDATTAAALDILRPDPEARADELTARATRGFAHPLYRLSPGGPILTAARVATYRPLIERIARDGKEDPDLLEAIVYLESAGRPDAMASDDVRAAAGFTQIVAETGTNLLGMKIDLERSRQLTRLIGLGGRKKAAREAERRRVDPRFDPAEALKATIRYLEFARGELGGRRDLAVASYHMGVGNLQRVLNAYGKGNVPFVRLFFGTDPQTTPQASRILSDLEDDSQTYYWRVLAAQRIMAQFRRDPTRLAREAELQQRKASAEDLLHPPDETDAFKTPAELRRALERSEVRALPRAAMRRNGLSISDEMGELAPRLGQPRSRYRALRPGALGGLLAIGATVKELNRGRGRLTVTSTVRDERYQARLGSENVQATNARSQHTTGWAVDVSRRYTGAQATAFQWTLTRLQALDLIAWVREPSAIHLTFAPEAEKLFGPVLQRALGG